MAVPTPPLPGITALSVKGFKSLADETRIEIRPLTVLAGANSSGKSSIVQPLLMLKQTLEDSVDRGPLSITGGHVQFSLVEQFWPRGASKQDGEFAAGIETGDESWRFSFRTASELPLVLTKVGYKCGAKSYTFAEGEYAESQVESDDSLRWPNPSDGFPSRVRCRVKRDRFLYSIDYFSDDAPSWRGERRLGAPILASRLQGVLQIRGLRGILERSHPLTAVSDYFRGPFDPYSASVLAAKNNGTGSFNAEVAADLRALGLTSKVATKRLNDTQIEVLVGRLPAASTAETDMVNMADVGFGVSQALPIVVALRVAKPGQLVYIEQPELHLHPRAQSAMAELLVRAANRGVRVVLETHSELLLLGIQRRVAEGMIEPGNAILHWFDRDENGVTNVTSSEMDIAGRFGDWPIDFDDVTLEAQHSYLNASRKRLAARP